MTERSKILLALAHVDIDRRSEHLREAIRTASSATQFDHPNRDSAWGKLGNLYEDKSWMEGDKSFYPKAIFDFQEAKKFNNHPKYFVALGRCYYRWVKYGDREEMLPRALDALRKAMADRRSGPQVKGEALWWLGNVYALQKQFAQADEAFDKAIALAEDFPKTGADGK
jgi:tetratricopeptide (TPR) repeat protein